MLILVTGGSGSGKSSFAEKRIVELKNLHMTADTPHNEQPLMYYIATMQVYGEEGRKKVERHRRLRAGKGFITLEQTVDVDCCLRAVDPCDDTEGQCPESNKQCLAPAEMASIADQSPHPCAGALLECMSNLVANEMFSADGMKAEDDVAAKVSREVFSLAHKLQDLVIVTNNVFEDGIIYDNSTMAYIRALGRINQAIAAKADEVWESVAGIPVRLR